MRAIGSLMMNAVIVVGAAAIGFGVPLGWVWIGSQLQGGTGVTSLNFSVAVAILVGIILTYMAVLWVAGWLLSRIDPEARGKRAPWMRGMTDTRPVQRHPHPGVTGLERLFIITVFLVTIAFFAWFFLVGADPLPRQ